MFVCASVSVCVYVHAWMHLKRDRNSAVLEVGSTMLSAVKLIQSGGWVSVVPLACSGQRTSTTL